MKKDNYAANRRESSSTQDDKEEDGMDQVEYAATLNPG